MNDINNIDSMENQLEANLRACGLNPSEVKVYLFLLENGVSLPPNVSRETFIARTNCYNILNELKDKGLVSEKWVGRRKAYEAKDPETILTLLDQKKEAARKILPDLYGLYTTNKNKPKIKFFDGVEGVKNVMTLSLKSKQVLIWSPQSLQSRLPEDFERFRNEAKQLSIEIMTANNGATPDNDHNTSIIIFDDSAALCALDEPINVTLIKDSHLTKSLMMMVKANI